MIFWAVGLRGQETNVGGLTHDGAKPHAVLMQTGDTSATIESHDFCHSHESQNAPADLAERIAEAAHCVGLLFFPKRSQATLLPEALNDSKPPERSQDVASKGTQCPQCPVGVVLGSGLGEFAETLLANDPCGRAIDYADIPHFAPSRVAGHMGRLVFTHVKNHPVVLLQGRIHCYEGHSAWQATFPIRALQALGVTRFVLTGAAGGINKHLQPGDLMLITDQINLSGQNPLVGPNDPNMGPRFPDMTDCYCPRLRTYAQRIARDLDISLKEGVYASVLGPSYETPAEVRMLHTLGADAVAMSIGMETLAARHGGSRVLGIACITNKAAGLSSVPLTHQEVQSVAAKSTQQFTRLLQGILSDLPAC